MRSIVTAVVLLLASTIVFAGDFSLRDVTSGKQHRLSDFKGKWVVVNYWATWCPPCREELPELAQFYRQHHTKDAVVLGIDMEDLSPDTLKRFIGDNKIPYPVSGQTSSEQMLGPVPGLPTTYLVSPTGKLVARQVGPITGEDLEKFISGFNDQKHDDKPQKQ